MRILNSKDIEAVGGGDFNWSKFGQETTLVLVCSPVKKLFLESYDDYLAQYQDLNREELLSSKYVTDDIKYVLYSTPVALVEVLFLMPKLFGDKD